MSRWSAERRLEFIEFRLYWEGGVNRSDLIEMFGVSVPQASKDLSLYQTRAPQNAVYDKSARRYVAGPDFQPLFDRPDPDAYLGQLRENLEGQSSSASRWLAGRVPMDLAQTPRRRVDSEVLRALLAALRAGGSLRIHYQSMNLARPDPQWREITPHAFGFDGMRWHVRGWCHLSARFKDFLLARILGIGASGVAGPLGAQDLLWQRIYEVVIIPHPALSAAQQAVVAKDYDMQDGRALLPVRYAMLFYLAKRLGLLEPSAPNDPITHYIVAADPAGLAEALRFARSGGL